MKNINIGLKLVLVGLIVLILPIIALGFISIRESSAGLEGLVQEQLEKRTKEIALSIYNVLDTEKKLAVDFAGREEAVDALSNADNIADDSERYAELNRVFGRIGRNKELIKDYQDIAITDRQGIVRASASNNNIGIDLSERDYISEALAGKVFIGSPALSKADGRPFFPIAAPVTAGDGRVVGVAVLIVDLGFLWDVIKESTIARTGYTFVTDRNGLVIAHPDPSLVFEINMGDLDGMEHITERFKNGESGFENYVYKGVPKTAGFAPVPETGWGVFLTVTNEEFMQPVYNVVRAVVIVAVIGFMIAFIIFFLFSRSLTKPIRLGVRFAQEISEGRLNTEININRKDEIGMLADALRNMKDKLREVVENVYNTSNQVTEGSRQLAQSAEQLSQGATEQAANAEEVSSSVEQMGANIQQNTDNSAQTEKISVQAAKDAEEGGAAVLEAVEAMNAIAEKINVVGEIARQTNLLSLNAAIEAARAGEHGKGFAVVANEVGKLASVSQQAATDILEIAKTSVNKANTAGDKIKAIIPDIRRTADLVQEISASSNEQNAGAEQINQAMLQLDQVIQQNAASAEEASAMSEELTSQAEQLRDMISFFKIDAKAPKTAGGRTPVPKRPETGSSKPEPRRPLPPPQKSQEQKRITPPAAPAPEEPLPDDLDSDFIEF